MLDQENAFDAGVGGRRLFNFASVRTPFGTPIVPRKGELYKRVFSLLGQIRHCWVGQYGRRHRNGLVRCRSRNTPTQVSHANLVKPLSLLPGPGESEAIRSISNDPHKLLVCANTSKRRRTNSSRPDRVMISVSKLRYTAMLAILVPYVYFLHECRAPFIVR